MCNLGKHTIFLLGSEATGHDAMSAVLCVWVPENA